MTDQEYLDQHAPETLKELRQHRQQLVEQLLHPQCDVLDASADKLIARLAQVQTCIAAIEAVAAGD